MKFIKKRKPALIFTLAFLLFVLGLFQNPKTSYGQPQYNNETLTTSSTFSMTEFADQFGTTNESIRSLNFTLPSSSWNVTDIELNFTDIRLGKEVKIIEEQSNDFEKIKEDKAWGVQINITEEPTLIYGVYIFGFWLNEDGDLPSDLVNVQIRGYGPNDKPNRTIYGNTTLDMGNNPATIGWYFQDFSEPEPLSLNKGQYYLVINGTKIEEDVTEYFWFLNDPSTIPNLHISEYDGNWNDGDIDKAFSYKIEQKVNRSYNPENIKMSVEIDKQIYNITDGVNPYTGNVSISNLSNLSPGSEYLHIPINNNESVELFFNVSYHIKLQKTLISSSTVRIKEGSDNRWRINPSFVRTKQNYSVKFETPNSWFNTTVFRYNGTDWENVTKDLLPIFNNIICIPNRTITDGALWLITANSLEEGFSVTATPSTTYLPSQTIKITVDPPPLQVNSTLTFVLIDPFGLDEYIETIENPSSQEIFSYPLPLNPFGGQWKAFIFWNNLTDAGLEVIILQVTIDNGGGGGGGGSTVVTGIDPQLLFLTILYIAIASLAGLISYKMIKRHKIKQEEHRQKIFNKFKDVTNLNYVMIANKDTGLNVYEQAITGKGLDADLISGFLSAIRTFGIELTGSEDQSQSIRLEYKDSKILMSEFKDFRIINILDEAPSQDFLDSIEPLSDEIDKYYGKSIKDFDGSLDEFKGIKDLLERHYRISLVYPLNVVLSEEIGLDSLEEMFAKKALNLMKKRNINHFFVSYLLADEEFNVQNAEAIINLIEKKVFQPIE